MSDVRAIPNLAQRSPPRSPSGPRVRSAILLGGLALVACAYEAPIDPGAPTFGNSISGQAVIDQLSASGPAFLVLADVDNPTPPLGTGSPVTFTSSPAGAFEVGTDGLRAAPFAFTGLPDGGYYLSGLLDQDRNFHPGAPTLAGASCGDVSGLYVESLATGAPQPITVSGGTWLRNLPVPLSRLQTTSRPAFTYDAGQTLTFGATYTLRAQPITASFGPDLRIAIPGPYDPASGDTCGAAFWFRRVDDDNDGNVDGDPDNPLAERRWPRVILRWQGVGVDDDGDGVIDRLDRTFNGEAVPTTTIYATSATPAPPAGVALPAANEVMPLTEMAVTVAPLGRKVTPETGAEGELVQTADLPPGVWSVTIIAETGQTWEVPNELARSALGTPLPPPGVTTPADPTQGVYLLLP